MHLISTDNPADRFIEALGPEMAKRWYWELKEGKQLRLRQALKRQKQIAVKNAKAEHVGINGVGQCMMRMDRELYHLLGKEWGYDVFRDEKELMKLLRDNHDLNLKPTYKAKAQITHPGLPFATTSTAA